MSGKPILHGRVLAGAFVGSDHFINLAHERLHIKFDDALAGDARGQFEQGTSHAVQIIGAVSAGAVCGDLCVTRPGKELECEVSGGWGLPRTM